MKSIVLGIFIGLITFFFLGAITPVSAIEETVTCIFENSDEEQKCFATYGMESFWFGNEVIRFGCSGVGSCEANVSFSDEIIEKYNLEPTDLDMVWRNMEGCYGDTGLVINGQDKDITFNCGPFNFNEGFLYAVWVCEDGTGGRGGDGELCKRKQDWESLGQSFCANPSFYPEGVANRVVIGGGSIILPNLKSLEFTQECYYEPQGLMRDYPEGGVQIEVPLEDGTCVSGGCAYGGQCYPSGEGVVNYHYCSTDGKFVEQLNNGESCDGDFQCVSGLCKDDKCETPSFFARLVNLFRGLFN